MIIELPKRVGGTDVEYLQQQINSMKNQLENAYGTGGGSITVEEIKAMNLEVGKQIKMGPNAVISWLQVTDNEDVASVEATQKKIDEVNTMLSERITAVNNSIPSDYVPYDPYQTYIDGHMVITEVVAAQNLLIEGGTVRIKSGANDNYMELTDTSGERTVYLSPDMMTMWGTSGGTQIFGGGVYVGSGMSSMIKIEESTGITVGGTAVSLSGHTHSGYASSSHTHSILYGSTDNVLITGAFFRPQSTSGSVTLGGKNYRWNACYLAQSPDVSSDMRLKEDFSTDFDKYIEMLDLIEPTSYHLKADTGEDRKRHIGYIAQKVWKAMEDVGISEEEFAGFNRYMQEDGSVYGYGLCYEEFIPILHAKIKKLEQRIEELEATA